MDKTKENQSGWQDKDDPDRVPLSMLQKVIELVHSNLDTSLILHLLAQKLVEIADVTSVYIYNWHEPSRKLKILAEAYGETAVSAERMSDLGVVYTQYVELIKDPNWVENPQPYLIQLSDPTLSQWTKSHLTEYEGKSVLVLPLLVQAEIVGFTELWESREERLYTPLETTFYQTISQQIAPILLKSQVNTLQNRLQKKAETIFEIGEVFAGTYDIDDVMPKTLNILQQHLKNVQSCAIALLEQNGQYLRTHYAWREKPEYDLVPIGKSRKLDETVFSRLAVHSKKPVAVADLYNSIILNQSINNVVENGLRSILYIPLIVHNKVIGVLHINVWNEPRHFTQEEIVLCQGIAQQTAVAIENAQLFAAQKKQLTIANAMQSVGQLLTASLPIQQVYDQVLDYLSEIIPCDSCSLYLQDEETGWILMVAGKGYKNVHNVKERMRIYPDIWLEQIPVSPGWEYISDTREDARWLPSPPEESEIRSWIGALLLIKDRLIGVLNIDGYMPDAFSPEQGELLANFAQQAATALENARLHEKVLQQANEMFVLHQIATDISVLVNVDEILLATSQLIQQLYNHALGFVLVDDLTGNLLLHESSIGFQLAEDQEIVLYDSLIGMVVHTGAYQLTNQVEVEPLYASGLPVKRSQSSLMVPLQGKESVLGVFIVESTQRNAFTEQDIHFVHTVAGYISSAVERAHLYTALQSQTDWLTVQVAKQTGELKKERDKNLAILENAGEGIVFSDLDSVIQYVNPAMEQMCGYSRDELLGETITDLGIVLINEREHKLIEQALLQDHRWSGELQHQRKNGEVYTVSVTITSIFDERDNIIGFVSLQADISQLKEVERLKAEFVSNITHELRTPLTNIKNFVSLLERGRPEKRERYFQVINTEINRLNNLIQDLLEFSRLDAEFTPDPEATIDVVAYILDNQRDWLDRAETRSVHMVLNMPDHLPTICISEKHFQQVLSPIVANALTYVPQQGNVTVTAVSVENNQRSFVRVAVQDNGPGISEKELTHIFDRFYRGEAARAVNAPGTGVGLAVSQKIIEHYGGFIEVQSKLGVGSCFLLWFPQAG